MKQSVGLQKVLKVSKGRQRQKARVLIEDRKIKTSQTVLPHDHLDRPDGHAAQD